MTPDPQASTAAERWAEDLAAWAIPEEIVAAAPECPWHYPVALFASRAESARAASPATPSTDAARGALGERGSVLDVGCGGGAASLALVPPAARVIGVDTSEDMLETFERIAAEAGVRIQTVEGRWPDVADRTPIADVVVCHHVFFNAPDLVRFASALTAHARRRVVVELTRHHPMASLNSLWLRFHDLVRPTRPTSEDAEAVLAEMGLQVERADWTAARPGGYVSIEDAVAHTRRLLCLGTDRDEEIRAALAPTIVERDGLYTFEDREVTTLWWDGVAG
jgi:SAM-dependent methyltransferase